MPDINPIFKPVTPAPVTPTAAQNNPVNANSTSSTVPGVFGTYSSGAQPSASIPGGVGVCGIGDIGVQGTSTGGHGVEGQSSNSSGVYGNSSGFDAVVGETSSPLHAGVTGRNLATSPNGGVGIYGVGGTYAGKFDGDVLVNGTLTVLTDIVLQAPLPSATGATGAISTSGADCAEEFDATAAQAVEPGTVMVLDGSGSLRPSNHGYDRKVAGVISGAGDYRPGMILDRRESPEGRVPIALVGKVYCKADAGYAPIEVGDLLTTSPTPGHAMKACDPSRAFGAVIGKALRPLASGQGLVPILIALQ